MSRSNVRGANLTEETRDRYQLCSFHPVDGAFQLPMLVGVIPAFLDPGSFPSVAAVVSLWVILTLLSPHLFVEIHGKGVAHLYMYLTCTSAPRMSAAVCG